MNDLNHMNPISFAFRFLAIGLTSVACMGPQHFNDLAMREEKQSNDVLPMLDIRPDWIVADIGAGGGYFSFRLARAVSEKGHVYAVDINPDSIAYIKVQIQEKGVTNLSAVLASAEDSTLPPASVDLVFVRNAYHDIGNRPAYFRRLREVIKPGGRIAIIDYDPARLGFVRRLFGHAILEKQIHSEMSEAGYVILKSYPGLKEQSFTVFVPE